MYVDNTFESPSVLSLCTGMRGLERGIERAAGPVRTVAYVEIEAFVIENLVQQMEQGVLAPAPVWSNLKTFPSEQFHGKVHGITAGWPCQPFSLAGERGGKMIQGTCGHSSKDISEQLDLFSSSEKTCPDTSVSDTNKSDQTYKNLVIGLRKEYSQRRKLALLTFGKDYSSLPNWTTPNARDWKDTRGMGMTRKDGRNKEDQLPREVYSLQNTGKIKWSGNVKEQLNPAWVAQLMGIPLERIFFAYWEMESLNKRQSSHG